MPRRLTAIAGLYMLLGVSAILNAARLFLEGGVVNMNLTVFMLPVGIGLLHRRRSSRVWATFWAGFWVASLLGLAVYVTFFDPGIAQFRFFGTNLTGDAANLAGWILAGVVALTAAIVVWVLYTPPVSQEFATAPSRARATDDITGMPV